MTKHNLPVEERFFSNVMKTNTCWLWIGTISNQGDAQIRVKDKIVLAHRLSYEMHNNIVLTTGQIVFHSCESILCVNPKHLIMGSVKDKTEYLVSRGRHAKMCSYHFLNPFSVEVTISNLKKFSAENNLNRNSLSKVQKGTLKSHKGYTKYVN